MTDNKPGMTPERIINSVISDGRLAVLPDPSEDTLEIVRKIAHGDMSEGEIADWKIQRVREIRRDAVKDRLKLKYLPVDFDFNLVQEYERYLSMSDGEQTTFVSGMPTEEYEFWNDLETARALYIDPVDKRDGSITQAKVDAHPDRYGW